MLIQVCVEGDSIQYTREPWVAHSLRKKQEKHHSQHSVTESHRACIPQFTRTVGTAQTSENPDHVVRADMELLLCGRD